MAKTAKRTEKTPEPGSGERVKGLFDGSAIAPLPLVAMTSNPPPPPSRRQGPPPLVRPTMPSVSTEQPAAAPVANLAPPKAPMPPTRPIDYVVLAKALMANWKTEADVPEGIKAFFNASLRDQLPKAAKAVWDAEIETRGVKIADQKTEMEMLQANLETKHAELIGKQTAATQGWTAELASGRHILESRCKTVEAAMNQTTTKAKQVEAAIITFKKTAPDLEKQAKDLEKKLDDLEERYRTLKSQKADIAKANSARLTEAIASLLREIRSWAVIIALLSLLGYVAYRLLDREGWLDQFMNRNDVTAAQDARRVDKPDTTSDATPASIAPANAGTKTAMPKTSRAKAKPAQSNPLLANAVPRNPACFYTAADKPAEESASGYLVSGMICPDPGTKKSIRTGDSSAEEQLEYCGCRTQ